MARNTLVPLRMVQGTTAQINNITGEAGEVLFDTDRKTLVAMDGVTEGGIPLAKGVTKIKAGSANITVNGGTEGTLESDIIIDASTSVTAGDGISVDGSTVSVSQVFQNDISAAKTAATAAQTAANLAKSTADTAQSTADTAQSTADTAKTAAANAQATANTAKSTADAALPRTGGTVTGDFAVHNRIQCKMVNADINVNPQYMQPQGILVLDKNSTQIGQLLFVQNTDGATSWMFDARTTTANGDTVSAILSVIVGRLGQTHVTIPQLMSSPWNLDVTNVQWVRENCQLRLSANNRHVLNGSNGRLPDGGTWVVFLYNHASHEFSVETQAGGYDYGTFTYRSGFCMRLDA